MQASHINPKISVYAKLVGAFYFNATPIIIREIHTKFQLTPPHIHWQNVMERSIRTFKEQFIAGLASMDPDFQMYLWCQLMPQAETTLNLMRESRINPRLSEYAQL